MSGMLLDASAGLEASAVAVPVDTPVKNQGFIPGIIAAVSGGGGGGGGDSDSESGSRGFLSSIFQPNVTEPALSPKPPTAAHQ
jgi:hypothetical protein